MAYVTRKILEPIKEKLDDWDKVLESRESEVENVTLAEDEYPIKSHVLSFRVTEYEYQKLMDRFGDPSGLRDSLLSELKESSTGLEKITIRETGDIRGLEL